MSDTSRHIVFAEAFDEAAIERMRSVGRVTVLPACDEGSLAAAITDCDALLVRTYARVSRRLIEGARRLRVIARGGSGLENVDLEAARERGIVVLHAPDAATQAVADLTVGLIIALVRGIGASDALVRAGRFYEARGGSRGRELHELTLGIVGLGRIGRAVARRCRQGFGMSIVYNDIVDPGLMDFAATALEKDSLYREADIVSLHVTLTDLTRGLIDDEVLSRFKDGAMLVNTSRGAVVDSGALARALNSGRLAGAGLDVFDPEPLPPEHPLMKAPNTVFTAHIGARTHRAQAGMNAVVEDVIAVLEGKHGRDPVPA